MDTWIIDQSRVMTRSEITTILDDLKRRAKRSVNKRMNLTIFRLATCLGLRVSEICDLRLKDIHLGPRYPNVRICESISKTGTARRVPMWWDRGTLKDIAAWKNERERQGAGPEDYFVCAQSKAAFGQRLSRVNARNRFISMVGVLGPKRQKELTIHSGRHTFVSHALRIRTPQEVRDAAGHSSLNTTSIYAHVLIDDHEKAGNLFGF